MACLDSLLCGPPQPTPEVPEAVLCECGADIFVSPRDRDTVDGTTIAVRTLSIRSECEREVSNFHKICVGTWALEAQQKD